MSFWHVSGYGDLKNSFQFILRQDILSKSLAIVMADMSEPWTILESLVKWTAMLNAFIDSLGVDPRRLKDLEEKGDSILIEIIMSLRIAKYQIKAYIDKLSQKQF